MSCAHAGATRATNAPAVTRSRPVSTAPLAGESATKWRDTTGTTDVRHLPCPSPQCRHLGALLPPNDAYHNGEPYLSGQYVERYACYRCGVNVRLDPSEYHARKALTQSDFERLSREYGNPKLKELPTRDLVAAGFKPKQAADLFGVGIRTAEDVEALTRRD